jgi:signal transduction histidine kinase/ligand-binding sensor domain-containing protein
MAVARRVASLCLLVLLGAGTRAPLDAERLAVREYSPVDGLASPFIKQIFRDSRGFLWFASRDGLSRFDGVQFVSYNVEHGLPHPIISDIIEARDGVYWVSTNNGVCRMDLRTARAPGANVGEALSVGSTNASNRVNRLFQDRSGRIWAGTDGGMFRLTPSQLSRGFVPVDLHVAQYPDQQLGVLDFAEDSSGRMWIATGRGLVERSPTGDTRLYSLRPDKSGDEVRHVLLDGDRVWLVHVTGLARLEPDRRIRFFGPADGLDGRVVDIDRGADGRIRMVGSFGIAEVDGDRFRVFGKDAGIDVPDAIVLAEDREGHSWIGTERGAVRVAWDSFATFTAADGFPSEAVHSIVADKNGDVFVVHGRWHISRFTRRGIETAQLSVPDDAIYPWVSQVAYRDRDGAWWALTSRGLLRFPSVAFEKLGHTQPAGVYTRAQGLVGDEPARAFQDSSRRLWVGTRASDLSGLARSTPAGRFEPVPPAPGAAANFAPTAFAEDRSGAIWVGYYEGGATRVTATGAQQFGTRDGLPAGMITDMRVDRAGRLWISTNQGGLARVDNPTAAAPVFRVYTMAKGLPSQNIRCLSEDRRGRLLLGTGRGLTRLDPETGQVVNYSAADGLPPGLITSVLSAPDESLWVGTSRGVSRLTRSFEWLEPPPVSLSAVRAGGVAQPLPDLGAASVGPLTLDPSQNRLEIDAFSIGYSLGESVRFEHRLSGADADWSPPTEQHTIYYANLAPGHYRFEVRAVSAGGLRSPVPATVEFEIRRPVWQRSWALAGFAGLVVGGLFGLHRYRLRIAVGVERGRTQLATDLHRELAATFTRITTLADTARARPEDHAAVDAIAELSSSALASIRDTTWALNPKRNLPAHLVERVKRDAADMLEARGIRVELKASGTEKAIPLRSDLRRQTFLIIKECLANVARHSGASDVEVSLTLDQTGLYVRVEDNGRGFDSSAPVAGAGLQTMRDRAAKIGGTLSIRSHPGGGTLVSLDVPRARAALGAAFSAEEPPL